MFKIRGAIYWQLAGLAVAVALISVLSPFFPVADFIEALQERVMQWGAWGAICYPLLFAVCNILLLPGGVLAVGGLLLIVGIWWAVSAKHTFTGPVRNVAFDEAAGVIEVEEP